MQRVRVNQISQYLSWCSLYSHFGTATIPISLSAAYPFITTIPPCITTRRSISSIMADPNAPSPFNDPDSFLSELLNLDDVPNPMLYDSIPQNPAQNFPNEVGNFEAGPSRVHEESHPTPQHMGLQDSDQGLPFLFWPKLPIPFSCSCCQVLREIIHTNGIHFIKLEIHGRIGMISHAIQHLNIGGIFPEGHNYQMFDFCKRSLEEIKHFLVQYCQDQSTRGYYMLQDPMSSYYEALCVGLDWAEDLNEDLINRNPNNSGLESNTEQEGEADDVAMTLAAEHRRRISNMNLTDLASYFHLPIEEAAKELNVCSTVLKRICRQEGLARWPHRRLKSIARQIAILRESLNSEEVQGKGRALAEIHRLKQEMIQQCGGVAPMVLYFE